MTTPIRLFLVDDHPLVRQGLKRLFELDRNIAVIGEAGSLDELLQHPQANSADLLLLDLGLGNIGPVELVAAVRQHFPQLSILVLTMFHQARIAYEVLKAGANGFLSKQAEPTELFAAAHETVEKGRYLPPEFAQHLVLAELAEGAPRPNAISARERQILCRLARGQTVTAIGQELGLSKKTVSGHKRRVMARFGVTDNVEFIKLALSLCGEQDS